MSKSTLLWLPAAFVLGGLIGRFGPAEELRAFQKAAERSESASAARSANGLDSFIRLANIPDAAKRPRRTAKVDKADGDSGTNVTAGVAAPSESAVADAASAEAPTNAVAAKTGKPRRFDPEDLRARIDEAAELWRTRIELKRATTIEKLGLNEKEAEAFDAALATMNEKLRDTMQALADELASSSAEMTPELGVRLMGDFATSVAEAYDSLGAVVDEGRRAEISQLQLYEFVDPAVAEPLVNVQDRLK